MLVRAVVVRSLDMDVHGLRLQGTDEDLRTARSARVQMFVYDRHVRESTDRWDMTGGFLDDVTIC